MLRLGIGSSFDSFLDEMGIRARTTVIVSADHGFTDVDPTRVVAPASDTGGHRLGILSSRGIEHYVSNTGGSSMGVYVRDKARIALPAPSAIQNGTAARGGTTPVSSCRRAKRSSWRTFSPPRI